MRGRGLKDSVVIVTGASRGLGETVARTFAQHGVRLALFARNEERLKSLADELRAGGTPVRVFAFDLAEPEAIRAAVEHILQDWGRLDVLVNVAAEDGEAAIEDTDRQVALRHMLVNYLGPMAFCQAVLPTMRRQRFGRIINVSSVLGIRATPFKGAYSASKAALNAMTDALRVETHGSGVEVSLICPGRLKEARGLRALLLTITRERAARCIVRCAVRPRREIVLTPAARVLALLNKCAPSLVDRILCRLHGGENLAPRRRK